MGQMKVFYDARWIRTDNRFDGVSRYSHELAWALHANKNLEICWIIHDKAQLRKLPSRDHVLLNHPENGLKELFVAKKLSSLGAEVVYSPFFVMGTLGKKYKLILTIHDMIYFKHRTPPQWLPWHIRLGWWLFHLTIWPLRWQLNRADHIATVSETARNELIETGATKRNISTVSNAVNGEFEAKDRPHYKSNHVVYMGAFTPYKNVECVIRAIAMLPDVTLHLCSKIPPKRYAELSELAASLDTKKRVVFHNGVSDEEYRKILANSRCAISASRIEGFGLPLIEAGQAGVPFVAADTPIFREVGGRGALFFNPDLPSSLAKHIKQLASQEISQKYIELGRTNAKRYSWDESAKAASRIIEKVQPTP